MRFRQLLCFIVYALFVSNPLGGIAHAIEVVVDYRYDDAGFFDEPIRRTAMQAVADRFSRVITSELAAVAPVIDVGFSTTWRVGFTHPATGERFQLSTAESRADDPLYNPAQENAADEYGFAGLESNEWILFAGARSLGSAGQGGTGTGLNYTNVFDALDGPLHRGVIANTPGQSTGDLPAWGGAITFDLDHRWNFDLDDAALSGGTDFYSIAMHEVAHVLGVSSGWNQWDVALNGSQYSGPNSVAAYNADHDANRTWLATQSAVDSHWQDGAYQSRIFAPGEPNRVGTVGDGFQDLLMEPIANFDSSQRRFELTNVDAAALVDIGWSILEAPDEDPLDIDADGLVGIQDIDLACASGEQLQPYWDALGSLSADFDLDGEVGFSDFLTLSANFGAAASYSGGDVNCSGTVGFEDFLSLSAAFGNSVDQGAQSVPEPQGFMVMVLGMLLLLSRRRQ